MVHRLAVHPAVVLLLVVFMAVSVIGCGQEAPPADDPGEATPPTTEGPTPGGTFIFATRAEPPHLNPNLIAMQYDIYAVTANVYNALVRQDFDLSIKPSLAKSWDMSPDGLTYTFHLQEGVKWHDGKPFTSADVKFTIEEVVIPYHSQGKAQFQALDAIETPDDLTVVLKLKEPFPPLLQYLTIEGATIVPKHLWEGTDILENEYVDNPIGTGPFVFKEWVRGSHVTLERNPDYWIPDRPYADKVVIRFISDPNARLQALESGEVDYLTGYFPYGEFERFVNDPEYGTTLGGSERLASTATNVAFNTTHPIFKDVRVRQAIAHAIDKQLIIDLAAFGIGSASKSHIPSFVEWAHNPNAPQYEYDPEKAEALLDEAGYPRNADGVRFTTTLKWNTNDAEHTKSAEILQQQLEQVGIKVELVPLEPGAYKDELFMNWNFEIALRGIGTGPDPGVSALWRSYHSTNVVKKSGHNFMQYSSPIVDELFDKASTEQDAQKRAQYFKDIQAQLMTDLPSIPIRERVEPKIWRAEWKGDVVAGPGQGITNSWDNVWREE